VAEPLKPIGFWSYTSSDDAHSGGRLSELRRKLAAELQLQIGRQPVQIFQDVATIPLGTDWLKEIYKALDASSFLLPIVTPAFLASEMCCREVMHFRKRELELGRDDLIFPFCYIDVAHMRPDEVQYPAVLALLNSRQRFEFASLRHRSSDSEEVVTKLALLATALRAALRRTVAPESQLQNPEPPPLPDQGVGPHFELNAEGVIHFAPPEALDRQGNNVAALRSLHPVLCDLVRLIAAAFARTDAHRHLAASVERYREIIDQELNQIDFRRLYVEGVILDNARLADAADKEEPTLDSPVQASLDSLLQIHGPFVSATTDGLEALAAEERYRRRPKEERQYRDAAIAFAETLQNRPEVIDPSVASGIREAASQIDQGANPERSGVVATSMLRNVAIVSLFGATVAALPVVGAMALGTSGTVAGWVAVLLGGEGLKKSKSFANIAQTITKRLDHLSEGELSREVELIARAWRPQLKFIKEVEHALRGLAGKRGSFSRLLKSLDWIKTAAPEAGLKQEGWDDDDTHPAVGRRIGPEAARIIRSVVQPGAKVRIIPFMPGGLEKFADALAAALATVPGAEVGVGRGNMIMNGQEGLIVQYDHSNSVSASVFEALRKAGLNPVDGPPAPGPVVFIKVAPE
jgi:TIR domain